MFLKHSIIKWCNVSIILFKNWMKLRHSFKYKKNCIIKKVENFRLKNFVDWFQMLLAANCSRNLHVNVSLSAPTTFLKMTKVGNLVAIHRKQKISTRDQNLKDTILAVQRRIPRWIFYLSNSNFSSFSSHIFFNLLLFFFVLISYPILNVFISFHF